MYFKNNVGAYLRNCKIYKHHNFVVFDDIQSLYVLHLLYC